MNTLSKCCNPLRIVFCQGKGWSLLHDKTYKLVHRNKGWRW